MQSLDQRPEPHRLHQVAQQQFADRGRIVRVLGDGGRRPQRHLRRAQRQAGDELAGRAEERFQVGGVEAGPERQHRTGDAVGQQPLEELRHRRRLAAHDRLVRAVVVGEHDVGQVADRGLGHGRAAAQCREHQVRHPGAGVESPGRVGELLERGGTGGDQGAPLADAVPGHDVRGELEGAQRGIEHPADGGQFQPAPAQPGGGRGTHRRQAEVRGDVVDPRLEGLLQAGEQERQTAD